MLPQILKSVSTFSPFFPFKDRMARFLRCNVGNDFGGDVLSAGDELTGGDELSEGDESTVDVELKASDESTASDESKAGDALVGAIG